MYHENQIGASILVKLKKFLKNHIKVIKRDTPRPFVFIVRLQDEKNKIIERNFCAASEKDRDQWCQAFEEVSFNFEIINFLAAFFVEAIKNPSLTPSLMLLKIQSDTWQQTTNRVSLISSKSTWLAVFLENLPIF